MFKIFNKSSLSALIAFISISPSLVANDCCYPDTCNRFYIGAFGGGIRSDSPKAIQTGVAFFPEFIPTPMGGPLAVDARGSLRKITTGFGGAQIGYEWGQSLFDCGCSDWSVTPAAEIEGFWFSHHRNGELINPTARLPEHDFIDSFDMDVGAYFINGLLNVHSCCLGDFSPYFGGGIGAADISLKKAKSIQIAPPEAGINHFNSKTNDSNWAFAAQAKVGVSYKIFDRFRIFAEYRFLFIDTSRYVFGATEYPTHAPTTTWDVEVRNQYFNAFAVGLQFDL